jgi:cytochrome b561
MDRAPSPSYDRLTRWLHWAAAALVAAAWALMEAEDLFPKGSEGRRLLASLHFDAGIGVLALLVLRLPWRLLHPVATIDMQAWLRQLGDAAKALLYLLMLLAPLSGLAALLARPDGAAILGYVLPEPSPLLSALRRPLKEVHEVLANALVVLAAVHAAAALWHHFVLRDATLRRMIGRA